MATLYRALLGYRYSIFWATPYQLGHVWNHVGLKSLERYYNLVYDQEISPSGSTLAACDSYGHISTFSFSAALNSQSGKSNRVAMRIVEGHQGPIYCLQNAENLLVSGGDDGVKVWKWGHLQNLSKEVKPITTFELPVSKPQAPETNGIAYDSQTSTLYCGCGDNTIYAWDLTTSKLKGSFTGHTDYVHCVTMRNGSSQFLSGSEDGTVRLWDPTGAGGCAQVLKPTKTKSAGGEWVGCVAVDNTGDWVVCGGSMGPTFFHLSSSSSATKTTTMELPAGAVTQTAIFVNDRIITAGSGASIRHWSINGESLATVPSELTHVFSLKYNTRNKKAEVLTVAGDSSSIKVFTNLGYTAFSLSVAPPTTNSTHTTNQ